MSSKSKNNQKLHKSIDEMDASERAALYAKSPYFKKKNKQAEEFLKKHPLPEKFLK